MTRLHPTPDPFVRAFDQGEAARYAGKGRQDNPYAAKGQYRARQGWTAGHEYGGERMGWSVARKGVAE